MIPKILHRVVPADIGREARKFWHHAEELHPGWRLLTHQDPLDPADWPLTADHWAECTSGAQFAGLIRLEALLRWGGIYIDQDVEPYRPFDPLLWLDAFAAWEDRQTVPDAVLGATPGHPGMRHCLDLALERLDKGPWESGPGVTTEVLPGRADVLVLPPGSFFPYHYTEKDRRHEDHKVMQPWAFAAHHWDGSWLAASPWDPPAAVGAQDRSASPRLNLGCGWNADTAPDVVNVDQAPLPGVDVVCDLDTHPWPFDDHAYSEVRAVQLFEHLADPVGFMHEAHRVLEPEGLLFLVVPHWQSENSFTDPTHRRHCTERTWDYWCVGEALHTQFGATYADGIPFRKESVVRTGDDIHVRLRRL